MKEMQETWVPPLGREDALEEEMATHSGILTWRILWTEEPGGLQFIRLPDWASLELSPSVESCGYGLGPSPVRLG